MGLTSLQVCMDSADWFQGTIPGEIGIDHTSSPLATTDHHMLACSQPSLMDRRLRPPQDQPLKCPRCDSTHTKFCYYNNYSLTQPRYFCKACRRYWTKGGTLRNIPVGGGCRKTKKVSSGSKKPISTSPSNANINSIDNNINTIHHHHHQNNHHKNSHMININNMNSTDLQLSSMQFSGSNLFGIGNSISNATGFMFENLSSIGGGGNICSPFGGITLDSINNNPFSERGLIAYNIHDGNDVTDVKPNLLALEWQDDDHAGVSATSGGGYMMGLGSSWGGIVNGYGPSTTNPLV